MQDGEEPKSKDECKKLRNRTVRYMLIEGEPYEYSFTMLYLKCLIEDEAKYAVYKVHKGVWGNHIEARTTAPKLLRGRILMDNYEERYN